ADAEGQSSPSRRGAARPESDRDLITQAQSRADGSAMSSFSSRLPGTGTGTGRPAPAAWRKAAESVAARAAAEAAVGSEPAADVLSDDSGNSEDKPGKPKARTTRTTRADPDGHLADASKPAKTTKSAVSKAAAASKTTTARSTTAKTPAKATAAAKTSTRTTTTKSAAKPATRATTPRATTAEPPPGAGNPRPTRRADVPLRTSTGAIPALSGTPTGWLAAYQQEAAELLANGTPQRRRRRVHTTDPAQADSRTPGRPEPPPEPED
ncbi:MAG TPA: hypothetical protein VFG35_28600, partial [Actinoplanes sp.]|nr:hypothetical protein [Actinoplanes sp.]